MERWNPSSYLGDPFGDDYCSPTIIPSSKNLRLFSSSFMLSLFSARLTRNRETEGSYHLFE